MKVENINRPVFSKGIQSGIRNLAINQRPGREGFSGEFYRMLKNTNPSQTLPKFQTLTTQRGSTPEKKFQS